MFYNEAIPRVEKKVEAIGCYEDRVSQYVDLKHKLSLAKMEILRFFKAISLGFVQGLLENKSVVLILKFQTKVTCPVTNSIFLT